MIDKDVLKTLVIEPVLKHLDIYGTMLSDSAVNLLLGTAAHESLLGKYIEQINGPAVGIYQIEPATHKDITQRYLYFRKSLKSKVMKLKCFDTDYDDLMYNLFYQTAIARIKYWMDPEPLPEADNIEGLAYIWKRVYNTEEGKGKVEEFVAHYKHLIG